MQINCSPSSDWHYLHTPPLLPQGASASYLLTKAPGQWADSPADRWTARGV